MKKILVLFLLLFAVQVQAAGIYTTVARGTVTQANMKISAVDGTAFVDFSAADVLTTKLGHLLKIRDSSGRAIQGFIKAAGSGETLGSELVTEWNNSGLHPYETYTSGAGNLITQAVNTTAAGAAFVLTALASGVLLKNTNAITLNSGTMPTVGAGIGSTISSVIFSPNSTGYGTVPSLSTVISVWVGSGVSTDFALTAYSLKQVLTPSETGVTIVSTKGGSTFNFSLKNSSFNYNDSSGYTYEIIKVRQAVSIAGGAVTAANERLSLVNGTAFYFGSIDCQAGGYHDGRHWIRFADSSGYVAFARIKAEEPAGDSGGTLDASIIAGGDFEGGLIGTKTDGSGSVSTWEINTSNPIAGTKDGLLNITTPFTARPYLNFGPAYSSTPPVGALYKMSLAYKVNSGTWIWQSMFDGVVRMDFNNSLSGSGSESEYLTCLATTFFGVIYSGNSVANVQLDNVLLQKVTVPPATGALLENLAGTRNMIYTHPSFNPNAIANIQILYVGD